ncbi:MAG: hypothetical protein NT070_04530 [Cyanobacteria bacterium]|nr:hypothetical protein [Cyanobacteriota bacterium]
MNLILHEAPRLLANILILQPIDERYIWMPTTAILGEPNLLAGFIAWLRSGQDICGETHNLIIQNFEQ